MKKRLTQTYEFVQRFFMLDLLISIPEEAYDYISALVQLYKEEFALEITPDRSKLAYNLIALKGVDGEASSMRLESVDLLEALIYPLRQTRKNELHLIRQVSRLRDQLLREGIKPITADQEKKRLKELASSSPSPQTKQSPLN